MAPAKMRLRSRKRREGAAPKSSRRRAPRPEASPDSKCPICLDRFVNVASVERCLHRFCFRCIREWARNKAECPLCKQPFRSIFHSVRSEGDFKEYVVLGSPAPSSGAAPAAAPATPPNAGARDRRRARDPAPAASPLDEVALRDLLPWLRRDRVVGGQLRPFLLASTDHILHELVSFARSIEAMQCPPAPSYEEDSGSPLSIINISEDDDSEGPGVVEAATSPGGVASVPVPIGGETSLSRSAWDDETPGPSYSTLSPEEGAGPGVARGDEDECMIVGYVKPMAERTPELVQLSSDTSEEDERVEGEGPKPLAKAEPGTPVSPRPLPSTSRADTTGGRDAGGRGPGDRSSSDRDSDHLGDAMRCGPRPLHPASEGSPSSSPPQRTRRRNRKRGRAGDRSRSPRRHHRHRRGHRPSSSSSGSSSSSEGSRPEKPGGKRKYKTRHLERWGGGGRKRSPSVEIVYERPGSHPRHRRRRRRRRRSGERDPQPAVITVESGSTDNPSGEDRPRLAGCRDDDPHADPTGGYGERLEDLADRLVGLQDRWSSGGHPLGLPDHRDDGMDYRDPGVDGVDYNDLGSRHRRTCDQVLAVSSSSSDHRNHGNHDTPSSSTHAAESRLSKSSTDPEDYGGARTPDPDEGAAGGRGETQDPEESVEAPADPGPQGAGATEGRCHSGEGWGRTEAGGGADGGPDGELGHGLSE